jgi:hypothetical protein
MAVISKQSPPRKGSEAPTIAPGPRARSSPALPPEEAASSDIAPRHRRGKKGSSSAPRAPPALSVAEFNDALPQSSGEQPDQDGAVVDLLDDASAPEFFEEDDDIFSRDGRERAAVVETEIQIPLNLGQIANRVLKSLPSPPNLLADEDPFVVSPLCILVHIVLLIGFFIANDYGFSIPLHP